MLYVFYRILSISIKNSQKLNINSDLDDESDNESICYNFRYKK